MSILNHSKNLEEIEKVTTFEANEIYKIWKHPKFIPSMFKYLAFLKGKTAKM